MATAHALSAPADRTIPGHPRIAADLAICFGRPRVAGTRLRVMDVLGLLAAGVSEAELMQEYGPLDVEDIRACLGFAAEYVDHPILLADD